MFNQRNRGRFQAVLLIGLVGLTSVCLGDESLNEQLWKLDKVLFARGGLFANGFGPTKTLKSLKTLLDTINSDHDQDARVELALKSLIEVGEGLTKAECTDDVKAKLESQMNEYRHNIINIMPYLIAIRDNWEFECMGVPKPKTKVMFYSDVRPDLAEPRIETEEQPLEKQLYDLDNNLFARSSPLYNPFKKTRTDKAARTLHRLRELLSSVQANPNISKAVVVELEALVGVSEDLTKTNCTQENLRKLESLIDRYGRNVVNIAPYLAWVSKLRQQICYAKALSNQTVLERLWRLDSKLFARGGLFSNRLKPIDTHKLLIQLKDRNDRVHDSELDSELQTLVDAGNVLLTKEAGDCSDSQQAHLELLCDKYRDYVINISPYLVFATQEWRKSCGKLTS